MDVLHYQNSWLWAISIYKNDDFTCISSINNIAPCVNHTFRNTLAVYDGIHMLSDLKAAQNRSVSATWCHLNCEPGALDTEIAILGHRRILPKQEMLALLVYRHQQMIVYQSEGSILQQAVLQTQDTSPTCDVRSQINLKICAGRGAADGCDAVSGGPMMINVNNS
ncbi:unnamed protein product [Adineta ricciae]|uniref:Uncharacterized protein n=1 Tax=Adineta ricciae TaxID=249248 RepID=A0A816FGS3_ADIRI|nr:unnamed protein product [Adineta ricciae]